MPTVAQQIITFYKNLSSDWALPEGIELLFPFDNRDTMDCIDKFYTQYFTDHKKRRMILGINPGRFGAGVTGVPFTDPVILEEKCKIANPFNKRNELSSIFVYEFIAAYGGLESFYNKFFISSVCPLGFVTDGKNINYYDDKGLYNAVKKHIVEALQNQIAHINIETDVAFTLGKGLNYKYLQKLNEENQFFDKIIPLPHPRWVMQYRRKSKDAHIQKIVESLNTVINANQWL